MVSAQILALTIYICIFINFLSFIDLNFFYMWKIRASRSEPDCNNYMGKYHKRVYHHIYSVQSECILSYFSRVWFFVTPWTVACQAPLPMRFSRQIYWRGLPCPPPGDLPNSGINPTSLRLLHWQANSLPLVPHTY